MLGPGHPAFTRDDKRNGFSEFWNNEDEVLEINCRLLLRTSGGPGHTKLSLMIPKSLCADRHFEVI